MLEANRVPVNLEGVEETLLIPLWARARESRRADALVRDERAAALVAGLDYDFTRFDRNDALDLIATAIPVRTELLDRAVAAFLVRHPHATIVNLGSGLDTRMSRLDNGLLSWIDVDLPRSMALRRHLLPAGDRQRTIEGSVLEPDWLAALDVPPGSPVLVVAEGLFMYLPEPELRTLFARMAERLPGAEVLFEAVSPLALVGSLPGLRRAGILGIRASLAWGLWSGRALESWLPGLRWIEDWCYFDQHPDRWGVLGLAAYLPFARSLMRIEHVQLPGRSGPARAQAG